MFDIIETKSMVDGDSYVVWHDFHFDSGGDDIFILHMQGKPKVLYKMMKQLDEQNKDYYFCEGMKGAWRNHQELVGKFDNGLNIYRYVR